MTDQPKATFPMQISGKTFETIRGLISREVTYQVPGEKYKFGTVVEADDHLLVIRPDVREDGATRFLRVSPDLLREVHDCWEVTS